MNKNFFSKLLMVILIIAVIVLSYLVITLRMEIQKNVTSESQMTETKSVEENNDDASATETVDASDDKIIISMFDCLLGTFESNKWYNAEYYAEDDLLLDKQMYEEEVENGSNYYLHEYGKETVDFGKEIISKTEDYEYVVEDGLIVDSHFRIKSGSSQAEGIQIITNRKENIFPYSTGVATVSQETLKIVNQLKKDLYIDMIETQISKIISVDYDKDGKQEQIVIINTVRDDQDNVLADNGACTLVIAIDDNDYKVIFRNVVYKDQIRGVNAEMYTNDVIVTDINYNGKPEVCISGGVWDIPIYSIHEYEDITENFETVLYGEFAW